MKYLIKNIDEYSALDEFYNRLPSYLKERYPLDKKESVVALKLLQELDFSFAYQKLKYTALNKPYLEDNRYYLSISHSHGEVMCAISEYEIGIDLEMITTKKYENIVNHFFKESQSLIHNQDDFLIYWTRFEALGKLLGRGIYGLDKKLDLLSNNYVVYDNNTYYFKTVKTTKYYYSIVSKDMNLLHEAI